MATLVGTQSKFSDALYSLIELHYNAVKAYEAAIGKIEKQSYQAKLKEFKQDHEQHAKEFSEILLGKECDVPQGPSFKQWLEIGKVKWATIIGDKQILSALKGNEDDAYERINKHEDKWPELTDRFIRALEEEGRHKRWLEQEEK